MSNNIDSLERAELVSALLNIKADLQLGKSTEAHKKVVKILTILQQIKIRI